MTTSSGLGPANGSVIVAGSGALYGNVKRLPEGLREEDVGLLLNIVFANAEGSAWSSGEASVGMSGLVCRDSLSTGVGIFVCGFESLRLRCGNPREEDPAFDDADLEDSSVRFAMGCSTLVLELDLCS